MSCLNLNLYIFDDLYYSPEAMLRFWRILKILYGAKTVLTRSAITLPKVNRCGWNLEQCEPNVEGWSWQILGAIRSVATVWQQAEILCYFVMRITHNFSDFPSDKFYDIWTQRRWSVSPCKLSEQNFENFATRGRFSKKSAKIANKISRSCDIRPSYIRNVYTSPEIHGQSDPLRDV